MNRSELVGEIRKKESFLCVGLDTDFDKIPAFLKKLDDPVFEFNKRIIDATKEYCVAYKPNIAFYEVLGSKGWESLKKTIDYIPDNILTIADAKRGDIGNTANMYSKTFFELYNFDAVTVSPYMGLDTLVPFIAFKNKWTIVLGVTSNPGSKDFQFISNDGQAVYQKVMSDTAKLYGSSNTMFVVGATRGEEIAHARKCAPGHFFLVPGVGKQGGDLKTVVQHGFIQDCGLLVNSSRGIIYAGSDENFDDKAGEAARLLRDEMAGLLRDHNF